MLADFLRCGRLFQSYIVLTESTKCGLLLREFMVGGRVVWG